MAYYYGDGNYQKPNNNSNQNPNKRPEWVSWIIIAAALTTFWPVGVVMLIIKLIDLSSRKTTTQTRQPTAQQRQQQQWQQQWQQQQQQLRQQQQQQQQQKQQQQAAAQQTAAQKTAAPVKRSTAASSRKKALEYGKKKTRLLDIFGWILAAFGTIGLASELGDIVTAGSVMDFVGLALGAGLLSGGIGMLLGSWRIKRRARRFAKYLAAGGKKEAIDIHRLAEAAEISEPKAERDVEIMVEQGLWGPDAYVDNTNDMLFRTHEAAAKYFDMKNPNRERFVSAPPQADEGFSGMLRNIRRANDRISDPVLSAKIDRLEEITGRIFKTIEDHPERRDKANTFLNYYLPTTQKLLDSYADFEEAGVSGANLNQAKARIEKTMDNIVSGFEHQLDELYQAEAMDVDSDIRVMENMLRRDTGTVEDDFGLSGGTAVQEWESE